MLGERTGRCRTGWVNDTDRTRTGIARSEAAAEPELAHLGWFGLSTGRLGATFFVAGGEPSRVGTTSTSECGGSVRGEAGAGAGPVAGETTLGGVGASTFPDVFGGCASGTCASGSEIGAADSSVAPQVVAAGI